MYTYNKSIPMSSSLSMALPTICMMTIPTLERVLILIRIISPPLIITHPNTKNNPWGRNLSVTINLDGGGVEPT